MKSLIGFSAVSQVSVAVAEDDTFLCRRCRLTETSTFNENVRLEDAEVEPHLYAHNDAGHAGALDALVRFRICVGRTEGQTGFAQAAK